MATRLPGAAQRLLMSQGFVLVEVMVAAVLLGVLAVSLGGAVQRACDASVRLRDKTPRLSAVSSEQSVAKAWAWGPHADELAWSPGPTLVVSPGQECVSTAWVGVWADGWQIGEWEVSPETSLELEGAIWDGIADQELVVRMRMSEGPWGPPSRTVVPDAYGNSGLTEATVLKTDDVATGLRDAATVVHTRSVGTPLVGASWTDEPVAETPCGVIRILQLSTVGLCSLACDGRVQSWLSAERRGLDVYW